MAKVLFTHSYFLHFDPKQEKIMQPFPPLATIYAAAHIKREGYEVALHDVMFETEAKALRNALQKNKPDYLVIYDDGFNYLTKMCLTNMRDAALQMAQIAKEAGIVTIISSSDSSDHFEKYLNDNLDFVIIGEGEESLKELLSHLENKSDFSATKGIAFKKNESIVNNGRRSVLNDLDNLAMPLWELIDLKKYKEKWLAKNNYFSINLTTTRGCPYKCNWCAKPIYGNRYNAHSPKWIVDEIKYVKSLIDFDHIWFADDIFGLKPKWVQEFSELIIQNGLSLKYKIQSRADLLLQENYVKYLSESGCNEAWMGAESGSQKILDAMDKGITVDEIKKSVKLLREYNIKPALFIQFGYLGEEMSDIEKTIEMLNEVLPDDIGISVSYPLPGTGFYDKVKNQLHKKTNWTDSDELVLMFKNTYSASFYKQLHRYAHKNYRKHQVQANINAGKSSVVNLVKLLYYNLVTPYHFAKLNRLK